MSELETEWGEWLTRDECIERYNFDPTGIPEIVIPSKLTRRSREPLHRVWLESAIFKKCLEVK